MKHILTMFGVINLVPGGQLDSPKELFRHLGDLWDGLGDRPIRKDIAVTEHFYLEIKEGAVLAHDGTFAPHYQPDFVATLPQATDQNGTPE